MNLFSRMIRLQLVMLLSAGLLVSFVTSSSWRDPLHRSVRGEDNQMNNSTAEDSGSRSMEQSPGPMEQRNENLKRFLEIGIAILVFLVVLAVIITSVVCICIWKLKEKRLRRRLSQVEKKEPNVEEVSLTGGYLNKLEHGGENVIISPTAKTKIPAPSIPAHTLTASHDDVTQTQGDEGYAVISDMLTRDDEEKGYELLTSTVDYDTHKLVPPDSRSYCVLEQNNEETGGYEYDPDYIEQAFFEPATREEELLQQIVELKVENIPEKDVEIMDCLGSGQFGTVNKAKWTHRDEEETEVAVKTMMAGATEEDKIKFLQEAAIMGQFNHCNILRILGIIKDEESLMIVVELMPNGDLRHHLTTLRDTNGEYQTSEMKQMLMSFTRQVACGLTFLFLKQYVHRDLAARNILVSEDGICKIADFGLSRDLRNENYYRSHGGKIPVKWTAPEALNYRKYSTASDVWSYGCLLYEIWTLGEKPYGHLSNAETMKAVSNGYRLAPPPGCPRPIYKIMIDCWQPVPELRPVAPQIVTGLQRPDFIYMKWSPKETSLYSEASRTLGKPVENGQCLHKDLQRKYLTSADENSTGNENNSNKIVHERVPNKDEIILKDSEEGNERQVEDGESAKPQNSNNEELSTDVQNSTVAPQNDVENNDGVA